MRLVPLAAVLAVLLASAPEAAVIEPSLIDRLRTIAPGGEIPVIITLADQADPGAVPGKDKRRRRERILRALREKAGATQGPLRAFLAREGGRKVLPLWINNAVAATVPAFVVDRLKEFPGIRSVALDETIPAPGVLLDEPSPPEWNISAVRAPDLWSLGYRGQGIVVANMDTGVDAAHPDLQAKWRGGANSWFDPNGEHAVPFDKAGHGTLVMGVMVGGDAGGTSIGVAPDAQWIAVKIFNDNGLASDSAIHAGFQWLLDPDGDPQTDDAPDVVNNSWGIDQAVNQCITGFEADVRVLKESGIAVVFSAGNSGPAPSTSISPANNPGSFSVGAVASDNTIGPMSSRGPSACDGAVFPHVVAPGVSVKSSDLSLGGMANYASASGTSIAAPHVSGAIALLLGAFPLASIGKIENAVKATAVDLGDPGADNVYGEGMVDGLAAFTLLFRQEFIGVLRNGVWYLDTNGNGAWDGGTDTVAYFGATGDIPVVGDWNGTGTTKIGVFRNGVWYLDTNGNGVWESGADTAASFGATGDIPVVGDWNGTGTTKIGVFRNGVWYLDTNGNGVWEGGADTAASFGATGDIPVVGDWNGTGTSKVGVFRDGVWYLDTSGNGTWDLGTDTAASFGATGDIPVVGDWNGTGTSKVGVFRDGVWYLDTSGNGTWDLGTDTVAYFGTTGDRPVTGRW